LLDIDDLLSDGLTQAGNSVPTLNLPVSDCFVNEKITVVLQKQATLIDFSGKTQPQGKRLKD
jgi:hypothetical protein